MQARIRQKQIRPPQAAPLRPPPPCFPLGPSTTLSPPKSLSDGKKQVCWRGTWLGHQLRHHPQKEERFPPPNTLTLAFLSDPSWPKKVPLCSASIVRVTHGTVSACPSPARLYHRDFSGLLEAVSFRFHQGLPFSRACWSRVH